MFFNVLSSESNDQRWNQRFETQSCKIGSLNVNGLRTNTDWKENWGSLFLSRRGRRLAVYAKYILKIFNAF